MIQLKKFMKPEKALTIRGVIRPEEIDVEKGNENVE